MGKLETFLLAAPMVLFSMVAHEYAHGYAALRQGDPTAYQLGRLTLNPAKHIDPFMTVLLPILTYFLGGFLFGGAKPVPVNPRNYRRYKRGDIIVSLAGIATNFVLALLCTALVVPLGWLGGAVPAAANSISILQVMLIYGGIYFNLILAVFNLIPIPPLDGSHVMKYLLPPAWALRYQQVGFYGLMILMLLFTVGSGLFQTLMSPAILLFGFAVRLVSPFVIHSQWTS